MRLTFLGTGTSQGVPVIACQCAVCKSADERDKRFRSSVLIEINDKVFCIDAGPDFRSQMLKAKVTALDAILLTHEHKDHIAGLDDVRAFNFIQKRPMDVFAHTRVQKALRREFEYVFLESDIPTLPKINLVDIEEDKAFDVKGVEVIPISVMHKAMPVLGFRIGDLAYITDANYINDIQKEKLQGVKIFVVNALQREAHISHFNLEQALKLATEVQAEETYFTHISHLMGKHEDVQKELPKGCYLAYDQLVVNV